MFASFSAVASAFNRYRQTCVSNFAHAIYLDTKVALLIGSAPAADGKTYRTKKANYNCME